jgi:ligand-binding sensor domain-containing protein/serine phosphatase RsbU (regulator of sigma subunit)
VKISGKFLFAATAIIFLAGCGGREEKKSSATKPAETLVVPGTLAPSTAAAPGVVPAGQPEKLSVTEDLHLPSGNNVHTAGTPITITPGKPYIARPGEAIFEKPAIVKAAGKIIPASEPEPVPALTARYKDDASFNIQYLDVEQGLPRSYVFNVYQDRRGNIWISTTSAISKYDGRTFTAYTAKEGMVDVTTKCVFEDSKGNIWFATGSGAVKYDGNSFVHYTDSTGLPGKAVRSIIEDKSGRLWFATNKGICSMENDQFSIYTEKQGLLDDDVTSLLCDKEGNIWCGMPGGLSRFDGEEFNSWSAAEGLIIPRVRALTLDKDGSIWLAGAGAIKFDGKIFTQYTDKEGLINNDSRSIITDREGNIWIGNYGGGVCKFDGKNFTWLTEKEGLTLSTIWCLCEDNAGNVWIGTDGGGVCKYTENSFMHFTGKQGMDKTIMTIHDDKAGNTWLGSYAASLWRYDGSSFSRLLQNNREFSTVRSILEDSKGSLWFGTEGDGLIRCEGKSWEHYTMKQGLCGVTVMAMAEDREGNTWIGTTAGLEKFDGKNFTVYKKEQGLCGDDIRDLLIGKNGALWIGTTEGVNCFDGKNMLRLSEKEGLSKKDVKNIIEDAEGNIWIGTIGGGINKYDGKTITYYSTKNGLSDDNIRSLVEDRPENMPKGMTGIWASTDNGIDHILIGTRKFSDTDTSQQETRIVVYKREDGLKGEDFTSHSGFQDRKGRIWWGSVKSLVMLDAAAVRTPNEIPKPQLMSISLDQRFIDFRSLKDSIAESSLAGIRFSGVSAFANCPENLELPYNLNNIAFNYAATDWYAPGKIAYQYMLEGADKEWSPVTKEIRAGYTSLSNGEYIFKVRAKGSSDIWSEPLEYRFVILPPWWKTTWAYALYIIVFILVCYLILKWRTKALTDRQKELEQEVQLQTFQLRQEKEKVEMKNAIIGQKQQEILDSINYAKQIQYSLLAHEDLLRENLPEHFVLFRPKDIVSGDFYWATKKGDDFYMAVCDSTGHGIPGAFMSLLNISFLNEAINEKNIHEPHKVLDHVRSRLIQNMQGKDGMDGVLLRFEKNRITYASGHNKPVLIRKSGIAELATDKMPVGQGERMSPFTLHTIEAEKGDMLYIFTDGYADQFGLTDEARAKAEAITRSGSAGVEEISAARALLLKGKKFKYKQLHELLLKIAHHPASQQGIELDQALERWKGSLEQVDDVCIIGVRL